MAKVILIIPLLLVILMISGGCSKNAEEETTIDQGNVIASTEKDETKQISEVSMTEIVILETSKGNIEIELNREKAPISVENFLKYVNDGFYDGTVFHRVIDGFMIQGGGFTVDGQEKATNPPIKLESENGLSNKKGTIAMARTSVPDSATSQFFINIADNTNLDYAPGNDGYAVLGNVIAGMDVVDQIRSSVTTTKRGHQDWPEEDIVIKKAYVKQ